MSNVQESKIGPTCGGKAASLQKLLSAGFPVPPFAVILPDADVALACKSVLDQQQWTQGQQFAVRSSSIEEDSSMSSFAGLLTTCLNVNSQNLERSVRSVRASAHSEPVQKYRSFRGLNGPTQDCAVVVQRMLTPTVSGVAFSVDPITGDGSVMVISAIGGLGHALVDGAEDGQTWYVDREGSVRVSAESTESPLLTLKQIHEIVRLTANAETLLGCPQDVEWAIESDVLWVLQSRPITTLTKPSASIHDSRHKGTDTNHRNGIRRVWDNANISESFGGMTTPLTFSFARSVYEGVYRAFCHMMRVPKERLSANNDLFAQMLGMFRGRVYYNLFSWYRLIALLPGYASNRKFMEQMMGVRESMPDDVLQGIEKVGWTGRLSDRIQFVHSFLRLALSYRKLDTMSRRFDARIDASLNQTTDQLDEMGLDQLTAEYRRLEKALLNRWDAPLVNDFFTMVCFGVLRKVVDRWVGPDGWSKIGPLLGGTSGMLSIEPARRIEEMGRLLSGDPHGIRILCEADPNTVAEYLQHNATLNSELNRYLSDFGDRCMEELKLETVTLHETPGVLWRAIGRSAQRQSEPGETVARSASEVPTDSSSVFDAVKGHPVRSLILKRLIRGARYHLVLRENLRFQRTRVFGRVRRIVVGMGEQLVQAGHLESADDVFYLEINEILNFVEGGATCASLNQLALVRKQAFDEFRKLAPPPERFETRGAVLLNDNLSFSGVTSAAESQLHGLGCYPGIVRGIAMRVTSPATVQPEPGRILVAERTDPGWVMLFPGAAGVLVQRGSVLSHSATLAREMSIPTIVGIKGLMDRISDGDLIEMNGSSGTVQVIRSFPSGSAPTSARSAG
ncbi:MAG: hypothetical protein JNL58_17365 [Planctomyces sp.]|nr:hypothetical protein [Planctomyces sp.]